MASRIWPSRSVNCIGLELGGIGKLLLLQFTLSFLRHLLAQSRAQRQRLCHPCARLSRCQSPLLAVRDKLNAPLCSRRQLCPLFPKAQGYLAGTRPADESCRQPGGILLAGL